MPKDTINLWDAEEMNVLCASAAKPGHGLIPHSDWVIMTEIKSPLSIQLSALSQDREAKRRTEWERNAFWQDAIPQG